MNVVALILAGGSGLRLGGVRKGDLRLAGVSLRDRVTRTMQGQCTTLLYSAPDQSNQGDSRLLRLPDAANAPAGPAAGLFTGAEWCRANAPESLMVSVAVDSPFFPEDFVQRALEHMTDETSCVVGSWDGHGYPTIALWRPAPLLAVLASYPLRPKGPSLRDIQNRLNAVFLDYKGVLEHNPFEGVNTVSDLIALSRRLKTQG